MTSTRHPSVTPEDDAARAEADLHKPSLDELLSEGVSPNAVVALFAGRDALQAKDSPQAVASLIGRVQQQDNPFTAADVWPDGTPEHWVDPMQYDPTDAELEAAWTGPDAPLAHRVAWQLHQELHDRSAS